ncbi:hypothetical protein GGR51DRAFT_265715 [Nemania sp. FL0031]|nr:hypothetical protein GGR51DRAFT_265715 [Nemania sp. FL0031]
MVARGFLSFISFLLIKALSLSASPTGGVGSSIIVVFCCWLHTALPTYLPITCLTYLQRLITFLGIQIGTLLRRSYRVISRIPRVLSRFYISLSKVPGREGRLLLSGRV